MVGGYLQNQALLALTTLAGEQCGAGSGLENLTHAMVGLGRALEVFVGTDLLADFLTLSSLLALCIRLTVWLPYLLRRDGLL